MNAFLSETTGGVIVPVMEALALVVAVGNPAHKLGILLIEVTPFGLLLYSCAHPVDHVVHEVCAILGISAYIEQGLEGDHGQHLRIDAQGVLNQRSQSWTSTAT